MFIGKSVRPRVYKINIGQDHDLSYYSSKNSWTVTLFFDWLKTFDEKVIRENRKVQLLIDNCPVCGTIDNLPQLKILISPPSSEHNIKAPTVRRRNYSFHEGQVQYVSNEARIGSL